MATNGQPTLTDRIFKDKQGKVVVIQKPSLLLYLWLITMLLNKLFSGSVSTFLSVLSFGLIFTWAWLEITKGDSLFRRIIGFVVLFFILYGRRNG